MKNLILCCCFMVLITGVCFSQSSGSTVYVAVKTADLRASTGFFSGKVEELKKGDAVTVIGDSGKWLQVRTSGNKTGWALSDNFSSRIVSASNTANATAREVALAGKGFSAEAETVYRKEGLDYSAVDAMEQQVVTPADLEQFVNEGRLKRGE